MPLFCSSCSAAADDDAPYCEHCGSDLLSASRLLLQGAAPDLTAPAAPHRCVCAGDRLRFDPLTESMTSVFRCSKYPERIDCVACPVCRSCGELRCVCGGLAITISVSTKKGTVIETVPSRLRLV